MGARLTGSAAFTPRLRCTLPTKSPAHSHPRPAGRMPAPQFIVLGFTGVGKRLFSHRRPDPISAARTPQLPRGAPQPLSHGIPGEMGRASRRGVNPRPYNSSPVRPPKAVVGLGLDACPQLIVLDSLGLVSDFLLPPPRSFDSAPKGFAPRA